MTKHITFQDFEKIDGMLVYEFEKNGETLQIEPIGDDVEDKTGYVVRSVDDSNELLEEIGTYSLSFSDTSEKSVEAQEKEMGELIREAIEAADDYVDRKLDGRRE